MSPQPINQRSSKPCLQSQHTSPILVMDSFHTDTLQLGNMSTQASRRTLDHRYYIGHDLQIDRSLKGERDIGRSELFNRCVTRRTTIDRVPSFQNMTCLRSLFVDSTLSSCSAALFVDHVRYQFRRRYLGIVTIFNESDIESAE